MAAYLDARLEKADGDAAFIAKALGEIRAKGMAQAARESLYNRASCSGGRFLTVTLLENR